MKRIFSFLIMAAMIVGISFPTHTASAQEPSVSVLFPADGEVIENEQCEVLVETSSADEIVYEFDGKIIDLPLLTPEMLTIGKHSLCVYAISQEGAVSSAKSEFSVQKNIRNVRLSTDLSGADSVDLTEANPYVYSTDSSNTVAVRMMRQAAQSHGAILSVTDGPDGEGDVALKTVSPAKFTNSRPYFNIAYANKTITKTAVVEHDILMADNNTTLQYELKASDNASWYPVDAKTYPMSGGKFFKSSYSYEPGVWYHLKTVMNFDTRKVDMYATKCGTDEQMHILDSQDMMASGINLSSVRVTYFCGAANGGYSIDNISVYEQAQFTGIKELGFFYGDSLSDDICPDAESLTALGIVFDEKVIAQNILQLLEITDASGNSVEISSVALDAGSKTLIANFVSSLDANCQYFVKVALDAVYSGECNETDIMETSFKTASDSYDVSSVDFSVNGTKLITKNQLLGKKLKCEIEISNSGSDDENLSAVIAVRSGDKLVGICALNFTVPAGSNGYTVDTETATLPDNLEDVTIQVMYLDSLQTRKPVFSTYEIKY